MLELAENRLKISFGKIRIRRPYFAGASFCFVIAIAFLLYRELPLISSEILNVEGLGQTTLARPLVGSRGTALVFVDAQKTSPLPLARHLASTGLLTAVVDVKEIIRPFRAQTQHCLSADAIATAIDQFKVKAGIPNDRPVFITGIGQGALFPYLLAQRESAPNTSLISVGFSVELPSDLRLCSPIEITRKGQSQILLSAPEVHAQWRSVWTDKPRQETAIYIKEMASRADTYIAEYNTPDDILLVNEIKSSLGLDADKPPVPVVEMPVENTDKTLTLFYSGDGGWRDLDRSVAKEMVKGNYPVVGIDVLRYFWERKTPDQVTADLVKTLQFYRKNWGVKSFVLAGFSFGADILPIIYNRLPTKDKESVELLLFLALGNHADFEVHVGGWLGQSTREMPLTDELKQISGNKIVCIYGKEEKAKTGTACSSLEQSGATIHELPGGHHFDKDYPKLARLILDNFRQHGLN